MDDIVANLLHFVENETWVPSASRTSIRYPMRGAMGVMHYLGSNWAF